MADSIFTTTNETFQLYKQDAGQHTITEDVTANTFTTLYTIDVSRIPLDRLHPVIFGRDQQLLGNSSQILPDTNALIRNDGTGGLAAGTLWSVNLTYQILNGSLKIGYFAGGIFGAGNQTQHLQAPFAVCYFEWFIFYI